MLQRRRVEIVLAVTLLIGALWVVNERSREGASGMDRRAGTTRPSQEEVARQRLRSLGYLN